MADEAHARTSDPTTSHEAAASVKNLSASEDAVLVVLKTWGAMTDTTLIETYCDNRTRYGWPKQSDAGIRSRRKELVDRGLVEDSGVKEFLPTGRRSIVWRAVK